jgi:NAD(P)H dehydrogenase (quinone)
MFAITGITGQVGGAIANALFDAGHGVRAVLRDKAKAAPWAARGAEIAIADFGDLGALTAAFTGTEGVFVMVPPNFAPDPGFASARAAASAQAEALAAACPPRVVALSSIGGHRDSGLGLITQLHLFEAALGKLTIPTAILRPGWFMENSLWDIAPARETGEMASFLGPLDQPFPMIAAADIGRVAADALRQTWTGRRVIEIEGPKRYTPNEIASLLGAAVGRSVTARLVPRDQWEALFRSQGAAWPTPRIEMLDGFNSGWIAFERGANEHVAGKTPFEDVLADLVTRAD